MPPNIIMLVNDHQAFYGHPCIQRPHFARLAGHGVSFGRAYCASPLCCPSRKTMLTGLYPHHHGQTGNASHTAVDSCETYIDVLRSAGYRQAYVGKWHAGRGGPAALGCEGFSCEGYGNPYQTPEYRAYLAKHRLPAAQMLVEQNLWRHHLLPQVDPGSLYGFSSPMLNEALSGVLTTPKESHEAFFLARTACDRLEELAARPGTPFMLRVDFWGPHQPYSPAPEYAALYPPETIPAHPSFGDDLRAKPASYLFETGTGIQEGRRLIRPNPKPWPQWQQLLSRCYGQISMVDAAGGRILDKVDELDLWDNTLVLWTCDHGDALACHGGHFDKGSYLPEEVMRIPLAMALPGRLPQGAACDALVGNIDLAPTLAAAAGGAFAGAVDGRSLLELFLSSGRGPGWRDALLCETHGHIEPWFARMAVQGHHKYVYNEGDIEELYDLREDPYELENLAVAPTAAATLQNMRRVLARLRAESGDVGAGEAGEEYP